MKKVPPGKETYLPAIFVVLISALVFLPYAKSLTYYLDDWYYIYNEYIAGPNIFHSMFSVDRPARGYLFDVYFSLFGPEPFPYHVGAYLWRAFAGVCAFWVFHILWPQNRNFSFFSALLFTLYPGYFWWVSAIEYQPMIASLALQCFSILLTMWAIQEPDFPGKLMYAAGAVLTGWMYIALVEYAIGMEFFRFLCVYLLISRREPAWGTFRRVLVSIRTWAWNVVIPGGFIVWRIFFFENQRKATDVGLQLARFMDAPLKSLGELMISLYQSVVNGGLLAWGKQFYLKYAEAGFDLSPFSIMLTAMVVLLLIIIKYKLNDPIAGDSQKTTRAIAREAVLLGAVSLILGVLPVVFANRFVNLSYYSHYGLPVSLASAVLLNGLVHYFLPTKYGTPLLFGFVAGAVITHSLIAQKTITLETAIQNFWWQVSWRIPQLRPDTTLVTLYPYAAAVDNDLGLPEAANMIYFPDISADLPIHYPVSTLMPSNASVDAILSPAPSKSTRKYRVHKVVVNYGNILILIQPTPSSCVRVIDGTLYVLSAHDPGNIGKIAPYSRIENIRTQFDFQSPPEFAFGPEPAHGWCYYFEKADWAVQNLDWEEAARLADEALALGLSPADQVEWFPLIQAYAMTNSEDKLVMISGQTQADPFFEAQVCEVFRQNVSRLALMPNISNTVERLFCD